MIVRNTVYQFDFDNIKERIRILDINTERDRCVTISLSGDMTMPKVDKLSSIISKVEAGLLLEIEDPFYLTVNDETCSPKLLKKINEKWQIAQKYWPAQKEGYFTKKTREAIFNKMSADEDISVNTAKRIMTQFWRGGITRNAFMPQTPQYQIKNNAEYTKPRGARRKDEANGFVVKDKDKKIFEKCIRKYYESIKKPTVVTVYTMMIKDYYSHHISMPDGSDKFVLYDMGYYPSLRQFRYFFNNYNNPQSAYIARETQNKYDLKERVLQDSITNHVTSPGDRFEIDATPGDIKLVAENDRSRRIGRPIVYLIVDEFSRMITGMYVGLENASWVAASQALINMCTDKVAFCAEYGVVIKAEDWPCQYLPKIIIGDRGEMVSKNADSLVKHLGVTVENTPPYRGDLKGIIERTLGLLNSELKQRVAGSMQKDVKLRGDADPNVAAAVTIKEYIELVIRWILKHNSTSILNYPASPEQIADGIPSVPIDLWNWGIAKGCSLRRMNSEVVRASLLPQDTAIISSRQGVKFKGLYYGCKELLSQPKYFGTSKKIVVKYDPRWIDHIYYIENSGETIVLNLMPKSERFAGSTWAEYEDLKKDEKMLIKEAKEATLQRQIEFESAVSRINNQAEIQEKPNKNTVGLRENRKTELGIEREKALTSQHVKNNEPATIIPIQDNSAEGGTAASKERLNTKISILKELNAGLKGDEQ